MDAFTVMMGILTLMGCGGALVTWSIETRKKGLGLTDLTP
jgi:hypothetical protein